jgi:predicted anti-sigma-YlaC factor YlaD
MADRSSAHYFTGAPPAFAGSGAPISSDPEGDRPVPSALVREAAAGAGVRGRGAPRRALAAFAVLVALSGCSVRRFAVDRVGAVLASGGSTWTEDDDPELVAAALPFALKTFESLLAESPENPDLLLGACRGFVLYAKGFVEPAAEALPAVEFERAQAQRERALRLHLRALGYCRRGLDVELPGASGALMRDAATALARAGRDDLPLLYWTGAAWGSALSIGSLGRPDLMADLPAVRALFARALELDPEFDRGALDEAMIALEALPVELGGSLERASERYRSAVARSGGRRASPHVSWASSAAVAAQDRAGFRRALEAALAIDPDASAPDRLANRVAQARARVLLARADELFFESEAETVEE